MTLASKPLKVGYFEFPCQNKTQVINLEEFH